MDPKSQAGQLCIVVVAADQSLAIGVEAVREMVVVPGITKMPQAPQYVLGVTNLRGKVLPIIDLRARLGLKTHGQQRREFIELMNQRQQDHQNWLRELESSVREHREFKLATDHHKCAFGKWYDAYNFSNSFNRSLNLDGALRKFNEPHTKIHAIAGQVLGLAHQGDFDGAYGIIERTRNTTLAEMLEIFNEVRALATDIQREIVVVLGLEGQVLGVTVDVVESVEKIVWDSERSIGELGLGLDDRLISAIGRRNRDGGLILMLDIQELMQATSQLAA